MAREKPYRPLGGKARASFGVVTTVTQRLYLGSDHLLYVSNERFSEDYKRFYFRDIQALVMTESTWRKTINIILLILAIGCSLLSWGIGSATNVYVGVWLQGGFIVLFGISFAVNAALGPTCTCYVKTAVHTHDLAPLKRVRPSQKVFDQVRPLIIASQGTITEEIPAPVQAPPVVTTVPPFAGLAPRAVPAKPVRHEDGRFHALLFGALLTDCAVTVLDFFINHIGLTLLGISIAFVQIALIVTALVRQQNSDVGKALRGTIWGALGYVSLLMLMGYVHFMVTAFQNPGIESNQWEWIKLLSAQSPQDSPLLLVTYLISIAGSFILGTLGLLALRQHRKGTVIKPLSTPPPVT